MRGAEPRRCGQDSVIDAGDGERFLVGIEPAKALILGHAEVSDSALGCIREYVGYGDDLGFHAGRLTGFEEIPAGATAATTQADDHRVDLLVVLGAEHRREARDGSRRRREERRTLKELAA